MWIRRLCMSAFVLLAAGCGSEKGGGATEDEPNNSQADANDLDGTKFSGKCSTADPDYFMFIAEAVSYTIEMKGTPCALDVLYEDAFGLTSAGSESNTSSGECIVETLPFEGDEEVWVVACDPDSFIDIEDPTSYRGTVTED